MTQIACYASSGLSEIEKYMLLFIKNSGALKLHVLYSNLQFPTSFLRKIIEIMASKKMFFLDMTANTIALGEIGRSNEFLDDSVFSRLSTKKPLHLACAKQVYTRVVKILEHLYQNGLDLYMLNYNMDAMENIKEILQILDKDIIDHFYDTLYDFDKDFFSIWEKNIRFFNEDNVGLVIDISLNFIYKIINELNHIFDQANDQEPKTSPYTEFYENQQDSIKELLAFLNDRVNIKAIQVQTKKENLPALTAYLILYFHKKIGPQIFFETNNKFNDDFKQQVKKIMDVINPEPFIYTVQSSTTLNYQFELESPLARGNKEYLQISLVFDKSVSKGFDDFIPVIEKITHQLKNIKDIYKIFYLENQHEQEQDQDELNEVVKLKNEFLSNFRILNNFIAIENIHEPN